jgi:hypothetical protein
LRLKCNLGDACTTWPDPEAGAPKRDSARACTDRRSSEAPARGSPVGSAHESWPLLCTRMSLAPGVGVSSVIASAPPPPRGTAADESSVRAEREEEVAVHTLPHQNLGTHRLNEWYRKCGRNDGNVDKEPRGNPTCQNSLVQAKRKQLLRLATWKVFVLGRLLLGTRNVDTYRSRGCRTRTWREQARGEKKGAPQAPPFFLSIKKG